MDTPVHGIDTARVADLLTEYGRRTAMAGGNPYRARAYIRAEESLAAQTEPLGDVIAHNRLRDIPGIGAAIAAVIEQIYRTGSHPTLEKMRRDIPPGVLDFLSLPGLRPDRAMRLYRELGVTSLPELEAAVADDSLWKTRSLSSALQRKLKQALAIQRETAGARHMHRAEELLLAALPTRWSTTRGWRCAARNCSAPNACRLRGLTWRDVLLPADTEDFIAPASQAIKLPGRPEAIHFSTLLSPCRCKISYVKICRPRSSSSSLGPWPPGSSSSLPGDSQGDR